MKPAVLTGPVETRSFRPVNLHSCTKEEILKQFENAYSLDEWLFSSLKDEAAFHKTPDRLRFPLIFYYAHPAVVFVNKFLLAGLIKERVDEKFEALFETGVDEMSWDDTENYRMGGQYKWPPLEEVRQYRQKVRELVRKVIQETTLTLPITDQSPWWAIFIGIDHERIHLETSSVLIRQLPVDMVEKPRGWKYGPYKTDIEVLENPMIKAGDAEVQIGKDYDSPIYGWDNEYGRRVIKVPTFEASKYPITNRDFLKFVKAGGYENRALWGDEGWKWKTFRESKHPTFWTCSQKCKSGCGSTLAGYTHCSEDVDEEYGLRLMFDVVPLPLDWPAEVNYLEARAYCAWRGKDYRLPTEAEHHVMRALPPFDLTQETMSNEKDPASNIEFTYGSSTPVNMFAPSEAGFCDVFGNVWEWIEDHYNGLPGGTTHYLYDDFSSPCYDGFHTMMMGGSWASTGGEATRYARFSFRRHFLQHLGFRLARTINPNEPSPVVLVSSQVYVSGHGVQEISADDDYITSTGLKPLFVESTYAGISDDTVDELAKLIAQQYLTGMTPPFHDYLSCINQLGTRNGTPTRALVVGCGPGGIVFELTKAFDKVIGCDISGRCIDFATKLAKEKVIRTLTNDNGTISEMRKVDEFIQLPEGVNPERAIFKQLTWLPVELGVFDLVVVDGLDRVQNKKAWLARLQNILKNENSLALVMHPEEEVKALVNCRIRPVKEKDAIRFERENGKEINGSIPTISAWRKI